MSCVRSVVCECACIVVWKADCFAKQPQLRSIVHRKEELPVIVCEFNGQPVFFPLKRQTKESIDFIFYDFYRIKLTNSECGVSWVYSIIKFHCKQRLFSDKNEKFPFCWLLFSNADSNWSVERKQTTEKCLSRRQWQNFLFLLFHKPTHHGVWHACHIQNHKENQVPIFRKEISGQKEFVHGDDNYFAMISIWPF